MIKNKQNSFAVNVQTLLITSLFLLTTIMYVMAVTLHYKSQHYSFFIEFSNSYGISKGTLIRMRGVSIGSVQNVQLKMNSVLVLARINSSKITIPKNSIIETTQTGLLNESSIDIIPLEIFRLQDYNNYDPLSDNCNSFSIICHKTYITGDRGLNYDDLVRSTTRISQRFDDPRFFNLFYVFLQNSIELTENFLDLMSSASDLTSISYTYLEHFLSSKVSS